MVADQWQGEMDAVIQILGGKLERSKSEVISYFSSLGEEKMLNIIYSDETDAPWMAKDVLAHLTFAEQEFLLLFEEIIAGGSGVEPDFNIDKFNAEKIKLYTKYSIEELLGSFESVRSKMIDLVMHLSPKDLEKTGLHPALGESKLIDMIKLIPIHNQLHIRDVKTNSRS